MKYADQLVIYVVDVENFIELYIIILLCKAFITVNFKRWSINIFQIQLFG